MTSNFVHLHLHTEYSLLDGAARIDNVVKKAKKLNMPAIAITDHGNMYGADTFFDACMKEGIKPIIGCEFYVCDDLTVKQGRPKLAHLIILVKDDVGYANICKLSSISFRDGYHIKPRIDYKTLAKYSKGLICLSACLAGDIPSRLVADDYEGAKEIAIMLRDMFDEGDFYIEVQDHNIWEEKKILPNLYRLAKDIGVKTVATNDVHYTDKEDSEVQDVLMCIQMGKKYSDTNRLKFPTDEFYLKTYEEMCQLFPNEESINSTLEIADKCNFKFVYGHYMYPKYEPITKQNPYDYMRDLINAGLKEKYPNPTQTILDRIEYELGVISKLGYVEYYLIVWDYINAARNMGISVGPGRGSGAGSIIAYLIGITDIDPMKNDLFFERFLNPERVSAPDFDVDFEDSRRSEVFDYVREKYGEDKVVKIITFGTMAAKNAVKDVGRVLEIPYSETDKITKLIPNSIKRPNILEKAFGFYKAKEGDKDYGVDYSIPDLVNIYNSSDEMKRLIDYAIKLEDMPRQTGIHPCGVIIGGDVLENHIPLSRNGDDITTQYTGAQLEHLGLLKMDFLGLRNLTDIRLCQKYVKENYGLDIKFNSQQCDDKEVFKLISTGDTVAIFQLESAGFQKFMKDLKPNCIEDIVAGVSLYRPGPMDDIPNFVHNKHNPKYITYVDKRLEGVLDYTYGCIVYQEQVMKIVQVLAGYTLSRADSVRKMMGKKKVKDIQAERVVFVNGCPSIDGKPAVAGAVAMGVQADVANELWDKMEKFGEYAFNKSHAAAYAVVTYQTAYLKTYYKTEFITAVLNNRITNADEVKNYIAYAKSVGVEVLPPDINTGYTYFVARDGKILFGLAALKGVGIGIIDEIVNEREKDGEFKSMQNFCERMAGQVINKRVFESLIFSGAFDCFGKYRSQMIEAYPKMMERVEYDRKSSMSGQMSLFGDLLKDDKAISEIKYAEMEEYNYVEKLKYEKQFAGMYISGHPLDHYFDKISKFAFNSSMYKPTEDMDEDGLNTEEVVVCDNENAITDGMTVDCGGIIKEVRKHYTKNGNKEMMFGTIEDLYGEFEFVAFPKVYEQIKSILEVENMVTLTGKLSLDGRKLASITVDKAQLWNKEEYEKPVEIDVLYVKFAIKNVLMRELVNKILLRYAGENSVIVVDEETNKPYKSNYKVIVNDFILNELYGVIGYDNVKVAKKLTTK